MKKFIISIFCVICLLAVVTAYANGTDTQNTLNLLEQLNITDEVNSLSGDFISRGECLTLILRSIGQTDDAIGKLAGDDLCSFVDTKIFSYFGCAGYSKIAYGEECVVNFQTYRTMHTRKNVDYFFFPERLATVKETLAFMVRCLENDIKDYNKTFELAKEYGLINSGDEFIKEPDSFIRRDDFCTLIQRFLNQKRYKYFHPEERATRVAKIDSERSITYLEFLTQRKNTQMHK